MKKQYDPKIDEHIFLCYPIRVNVNNRQKEGKTPYCKEIKISYEPESDFRYSDAGYCVIQQVIEDIVGMPFKSVMQEYIFKPLNMDNSFLVQHLLDIKDKDFSCGHNKNGYIVEGKYPIYPYLAAAGLWTTPTDYAKLLLEFMSSLNGNSTIGLSKNRAGLIGEIYKTLEL